MARFAFIEEWMSLRASQILPYLAKEHEIHYIASGTDTPPADFASVKLFKFPRYQQQNSLRIAGAARKLYQQGEIDFVVDYSYMAWALRKIPFIEIVGGLYSNDFLPKWQAASWFKRPRMSVGYLHYCLPERICINRAKQIITDNQINAEIMRKRFGRPLEQITVVPNGVDETFSALYATKDFSRPTLLFVGTLHSRKGICRYYSVFMNARIWTFHSRSVVMVLTGQLLRLLLVVIPVFHIAEEFPRKNSSKSRKKQLFLCSHP